MTELHTFLTALAWIFGCWLTVSALYNFREGFVFGERERYKTARFRLVGAVVCWTWIIVTW